MMIRSGCFARFYPTLSWVRAECRNFWSKACELLCRIMQGESFFCAPSQQYDSPGIRFAGEIRNVYQFVNDERCLWVQTRVWFIAEQVLRIQSNGTGNGDALLHTATDLSRKFVLCFCQVHAVQTDIARRVRHRTISLNMLMETSHYPIQSWNEQCTL